MSRLPDPKWTEEQHREFAKELLAQQDFWVQTWKTSMRWMPKNSRTYRSICQTATKVQKTRQEFHRLYISSFRTHSPYEHNMFYGFN